MDETEGSSVLLQAAAQQLPAQLLPRHRASRCRRQQTCNTTHHQHPASPTHPIHHQHAHPHPHAPPLLVLLAWPGLRRWPPCPSAQPFFPARAAGGRGRRRCSGKFLTWWASKVPAYITTHTTLQPPSRQAGQTGFRLCKRRTGGARRTRQADERRRLGRADSHPHFISLHRSR